MTAKLHIAAAALALLTLALVPAWMEAQVSPTQPSSRPTTATTTAGTSQPVDKAAVAELIKQLGDDRYKIREKATTQLIELGWGVRPILEEKLKEKDQDLEVVERMKLVLLKVPFPPVDKAAVAELIKLLGDGSVKVREKATAQLIDMGPSVRVVLNEKLQEKKLNPEVTQRIKLVLAKVPPAPGEESKIVTDTVTGITFTLSDDGTALTASRGDKILWTTRFAKTRPATSIKLEEGQVIVNPQGWTYDPATGRRVGTKPVQMPLLVE